MCIGHASFGNFRNDVFTEVVAGVFVFVVFFQQLIKVICIKDRSPCWRAIWCHLPAWLVGWPVFNEVDNFIVRVHVHHAKRRRLGNGTGRHATVQRAPFSTWSMSMWE